MNKLLKTTLLTLVCLAFAGLAYAGDDHPKPKVKVCSNASLFGGYGFYIDGDVFKSLDRDNKFGVQSLSDDRDKEHRVNPLHLRGVSEIVFDGKGGFTSEDEIDVGGRTVLDFSLGGLTGTYNVNPDCSGSIVLSFNDYILPFDIDIVVADDGKIVDGLIDRCGGEHGRVQLLAVGRKDFNEERDNEKQCALNDTKCLFGN